MRAALAILVLTLLSLQSFAQEAPLLQLRCDGFEEEQASSDMEPRGRKSREPITFTLRIQLSTGLAEIIGLPLFATVAQDKPLMFSVSDAKLSYEEDYSSREPEAKFKSSLYIDRYSGVARESQVIAAQKSNVIRIFSGQYKCERLKDRLF